MPPIESASPASRRRCSAATMLERLFPIASAQSRIEASGDSRIASELRVVAIASRAPAGEMGVGAVGCGLSLSRSLAGGRRACAISLGPRRLDPGGTRGADRAGGPCEQFGVRACDYH